MTRMGFSVITKGITKGVTKGADAAGKGVTKGAEAVKKGVFAPVWAFLKNIWGWLKYVLSVVCCCCVMSLCVTFGVPQMVMSALE